MDLSGATPFPSFSKLLSNYPSPYKHKPDRTPASRGTIPDDNDDNSFRYPNQCAIRMSICLMKSGVDISKVKNVWNPKGATFNKDGYVLGAVNLATFLKSKELLGKPAVYDGTKEEVSKVLEGKTGIIFFQRYNENYDESAPESRSYSNVNIDLLNNSTIQAPYVVQMLN
jgi:hypothetical protein